MTVSSAFELVTAGPRRDRRETMIRELRASLGKEPRSISPKYFYDSVGSRLFDAICELPEYYPTRAERALLMAHSGAVARSTRAVSLVEIGSGMARKTGALLAAMADANGPPTYVPFDIAPEAIEHSAEVLLAQIAGLRVRGVVGDFMLDCDRLARATRSLPRPCLFAFLGSTVGNLDAAEASGLLGRCAAMMAPGDRFLLGVDLVKDTRVLHAAYNDARGVTADFNKNVLRVLARELEGEIEHDAFDHVARYDEERRQIEMHLVASRETRFVLRGAGIDFGLPRGGRILTEISRKFTRGSAERLLAAGGFHLVDWISDGVFALAVARKASAPLS